MNVRSKLGAMTTDSLLCSARGKVTSLADREDGMRGMRGMQGMRGMVKEGKRERGKETCFNSIRATYQGALPGW